MTLSFANRIAFVTGGGAGLGREYALQLARRGAQVVIADLARDGDGQPAAHAVADEIRRAGGKARASATDIRDEDAVAILVGETAAAWGPIDTLICNAGILRDRSFSKMEIAEFRNVVDVHLTGSAICAKAVWQGMRDRGYGRIVLTSSAAGLYGNFGQANYAAAKTGMIGLMNVLNLEGAGRDIRTNIIAPLAATAMTRGILPEEAEGVMHPAAVAPATLFLASAEAPAGTILGAGAGAYSVTHIQESAGLYLAAAMRTPEGIAAHFAQIADGPLQRLGGPQEQTERYLALRQAAVGDPFDAGV